MTDRYAVDDGILVDSEELAAAGSAIAGVRTAEARLMVAVLRDAVHEFRAHVLATDDRGRRRYAEVEAWFASCDAEPLFSFENVCAVLGVSAAAGRRTLFAWRDARRCDHGAGDAPSHRARDAA